MDKKSLTKEQRESIRKLWFRNNISWKLNQAQLELYNLFKESPDKITVFLSSRRFGKTTTIAIISTEMCLKKPNMVVKYLCPTQKMILTSFNKIMEQILEDCPKTLRPTYHKQEGVWKFNNGSEIQLAGNDSGRAERLRGGYSNLCIVDEAGFCDNLENTVQSILSPTTLTTNGRIILASTPSTIPGHDFEKFVIKAEFENRLIKKTIFENPMLSEKQIQDEINSYPLGIKDPKFLTEYMCVFTKNLDISVLPEFTDEMIKEIVKEWNRPPKFDYYVAADIGFKDLTGVIFGYLDFTENKLIIEDEIVMNKMTTKELADEILKKEEILLTSKLTGEKQEPFLRICDLDLRLVNDFRKLHGLHFTPTQKDNKEAAINNLRLALQSKSIVINPRCKNLILHLKNAVWTKSRSSFDRSPDYGHYDLCDAMIYMVRNVNWNKNPYPAGFKYHGQKDIYFVDKVKQISEAYKKLGNVFSAKKSIR